MRAMGREGKELGNRGRISDPAYWRQSFASCSDTRNSGFDG